MNTSVRQLADRLLGSFTAGPAADTQTWLWRPLLQLLATGRPATIDQLADATGRTPDQVQQALAAMPDTEYDDAGRIVGAGLTQHPTPHRFEIDGTQLYTWCALDTLVFPAVLGRTAHVESPCRATGTPVRLTVAPSGVLTVDPPTAVVSIVTPDDLTSVRTAFCSQVHFFAGTEAAQSWLADHPGQTVLPVIDAFELGAPLVDRLLGRPGPTVCG